MKTLVSAIALTISLNAFAKLSISTSQNVIDIRTDFAGKDSVQSMFPMLKAFINKCPNGDWQDWKSPYEQGRSCANGMLRWTLDYASGCEHIHVYDEESNVKLSDLSTCGISNVTITLDKPESYTSSLTYVDNAPVYNVVINSGSRASTAFAYLGWAIAPNTNQGQQKIVTVPNILTCTVDKCNEDGCEGPSSCSLFVR